MRYRIEVDQEPYDTGDLFTEVGLPDKTPAQRRDMEHAFLDDLANEGGPWGFIVERKCPACGTWETVDSCWGFDVRAYCEEEAKQSLIYHQKG